jgi:cysteine synthase A
MVDGYRRLGTELAGQLTRVDALCAYVGTAGCFLGATAGLRSAYPRMVRVAVEPAESAVLSGGVPGTRRIEGGGSGFWPPLLRPEDVDRVVAVAGREAFATASRAARELGVFSGPSTGANLVAAFRLAGELGPGATVATVQVDSGLKYLAGDLYG